MPIVPAIWITVGIVFLGQIARDRRVNVRLVVAVGFVIFFLLVIDTFAPALAKALALLILVASVFTYGPPLLRGVGLLEGGRRG